MALVNVLVLSALIAVCALGLFHSAFQDNVFQRFGMMGIVCWSVAEIWTIHRGWQPPAYDTFQYVALLLYACGSWLRVATRRSRYGASHAGTRHVSS
jgi:nitrate reductase gamma subunit